MNIATSTAPLLDSKTVAGYLGISEATLCRMRQDGSGPAFVDVRGRPRYRDTALIEWVNTQERFTKAE